MSLCTSYIIPDNDVVPMRNHSSRLSISPSYDLQRRDKGRRLPIWPVSVRKKWSLIYFSSTYYCSSASIAVPPPDRSSDSTETRARISSGTTMSNTARAGGSPSRPTTLVNGRPSPRGASSSWRTTWPGTGTDRTRRSSPNSRWISPGGSRSPPMAATPGSSTSTRRFSPTSHTTSLTGSGM